MSFKALLLAEACIMPCRNEGNEESEGHMALNRWIDSQDKGRFRD
jgi:hypothetical protein